MRHAGTSVGWDDDEYTLPPGGVWSPGRTFSALYLTATVAAGLAWIWAMSIPGFHYLTALASFLAFLAIGAIWVVCVAITAWRITTKRARRPGMYLFVVPAIGLGLIIVTLLGLPLRGRFELVRSDFDRYAHEVLKATEHLDPATMPNSSNVPNELLRPDVPHSIGGFTLARASIVPEGLLIFAAEGGGFAYVPDGRFQPGTSAGGSLRFSSLGGGWYSFTYVW
ncbi:MAG TPA: hypothetical protein VL068_01525 [Microthrixaceae bacterium]|nr:hypothetical protein [Microthrixaceae bacterium]